MAANKIGIQVTGANATIDLNGFTMQGSNVAWHGITGGVDGVTIKNGTITGFDFDGIVGTGDNWIVENMRVVANGRYGVSLIGDYSSVRDSTVTQNRNSGIQCNNRCLVEDSNSSGNGGAGIYIISGTVLGNVIIGNSDFGILGGGATGYGNNTLATNNGNDDEVNADPIQLQPNACVPACP